MILLKVIGLPKLTKFKKKHPQAREPIAAWLEEAKNASWKNMNDVWERYPNASQISKSDFIIFDIKGNNFRLAVRAMFRQGILMIDEVYTHAEYDKKRFEGKNNGY